LQCLLCVCVCVEFCLWHIRVYIDTHILYKILLAHNRQPIQTWKPVWKWGQANGTASLIIFRLHYSKFHFCFRPFQLAIIIYISQAEYSLATRKWKLYSMTQLDEKRAAMFEEMSENDKRGKSHGTRGEIFIILDIKCHCLLLWQIFIM